MSPHDVFTPFVRRFTDEHARSLKDTRKLYARVTAAHRASRWGHEGALESVSNAIVQSVCETIELPNYTPLAEGLDTCQLELLALETTIFSTPEVDFSEPLSLKGQVDLNRFLRAQDHFLSHQEQASELLSDALTSVAITVLKSLPTFEQAAFAVPLISLVQNPGCLVDSIINVFANQKYPELGIFAALTAQLHRNIYRASGIPIDGASKKPLVWPSESELTPHLLVETYLRNTPLEQLLLTPCPLSLPGEQRFSGHWIVAPPGRGKTTLLHALVVDDFAKDAAIVLMDSKGDLIEPLKQLECIKDRLLLIEPDPDAAFALNPLDITHSNVTQAVGLIEYIMAGLLDAKFTALQTTLFRNVVPAIIESIPNATLDTFKEVMVRGLPSLDKLNPHARQFFESRETGFDSKTYDSTRKEVVWRLDYLLTNPVMRSMFSATHTRLDMGKAMDEGRVIIINNSKVVLGDEGAEFFGRFFIALIARAAQQRSGKPASSKKPCFVYIDECQSVIAKDTRIPILLDECRSQKIGLILSHQRTAQLTPPVLDAVANCAIRMANSDDEAKYLSSKLRMDPEELQALPRGTFGTFVRDLTPRGIKLEVTKIELDDLPHMTEAEFQAIRHRMRQDFSPMPVAPQHDTTTTKPEDPPRQPGPVTASAEAPEPELEKQKSAAADPGEPSDKW